MNQTIKNIIPKFIYNSLQEYWFNIKFGKYLKKNIELKNKYLGKRCFLIGNGSSIRKMNLTPLKDEYVFAVNEFFLHPDVEIIKPDFFSYIEPQTSNLGSEYFDKVFTRLSDLKRKNSEMKLFLNLDSHNYIKKKEFFSNEDGIYFLKGIEKFLNSGRFRDDISKVHSFMNASPYNALCCIAYMGFKDIYFIGCDCDVFTQRGEGTSNYYFYNVNELPQNTTWKHKDNEELLYENYLILKQWRLATNFFKKKGINIYNAGINGDNDTCERVDFKTLFD